VATAKRHRELIAHSAAERTALCKSNVMRVNGMATAYQARVSRNVLDVYSVSNPAGFGYSQRTFIDAVGSFLFVCAAGSGISDGI
jgi:hypothetical protein